MPDACFNGQEDLFQRIGLVSLEPFNLVKVRNFVFLLRGFVIHAKVKDMKHFMVSLGDDGWPEI